LDAGAARKEIEEAVDLAVHYAGWTDKLHAVLGTVNPVAAPHFNFTMPEPTGVVGVIAPDEPDVLGLIAEILPPLAAGNVVVAIVSERWPLLSLHLGEVLGVADVPAGVVNLLSGLRAELVKPLAGHRDVDAILDTTGDPEVTRLGSESVTRVVRPGADDGLSRIEPFVELKTAWHPVGT
jgi:acyl-CoA reductase-like NAD-dependent aldehyde dehydrogenase